MSKYDMKKVAGLCKSLGGEFEQSKKDFNCNFSKEQKAQKREFWDKIETLKEGANNDE
jgi:hypothetical protein